MVKKIEECETLREKGHRYQADLNMGHNILNKQKLTKGQIVYRCGYLHALDMVVPKTTKKPLPKK